MFENDLKKILDEFASPEIPPDQYVFHNPDEVIDALLGNLDKYVNPEYTKYLARRVTQIPPVYALKKLKIL